MRIFVLCSVLLWITSLSDRFFKFLLFLGYPVHLAKDMKVHVFAKIVTEFALEYKTTRDKVLQMREKKANQRERKKTRGKMIVEVMTSVYM